MDSSKEVYSKANSEENDLKALGLYVKALRQERCEKFDKYLPYLEKIYDVEERKNSSFSIKTESFGIIDYFPKANKLLIRKDNQWIKPGLKWIINNLIPIE